MSLDLPLVLAVAALSGLLGALLALRARSAPPFQRLAWALLPTAGVGVLLVAWAAFRLVPFWTWSAARLAASARLAYGFPLYAEPGATLITGWVYGPVNALAYLPAVWWGEPLAALRAATWLNVLYFFLPLALLTAGLWRQPGTRLVGAVTVLFGAAALLAPYATWYAAASLNADTVAVCLGVLSCLLLDGNRSLSGAAALCILAAWTKQVAAPLAAAQLAFLLWRCGWRRTLTYAGWLAAAGLATTVVFGGWFGFAALWHATVTIPSRHPIEAARLGGLALSFLQASWWVWALALLARPWRRSAPAEAAAAGRSLLLLLASLATLPGGIAAAAKTGGDQNSLHAIAYATYAGLALLTDFAHAPVPRLAPCTLGGLLAGLCAFLGSGITRLVVNDHLAVETPGAQHRAAYAFARAHPGQAYFPCNPLISLMAERRDYPFDYGVYDWRLAGAAPDAARLRAQLPASLAFIIYHEKDMSREVLRAFPAFNRLHQAGPWDMFLRSTAPVPERGPAPAR